MEGRRMPGPTVSYRNLLVVAAFIFLLPIWARLVPGSALHFDIVNLMVLAGIYAFAVIGLNLLVGYAGQVSLGHAAFFGIGAYTTAILCTRFAWFPTWLGVLFGALLAGVAGLLIGIPVLRLKGNYLAIATLAFGEISYIFFRQSGITGGTVGITRIPPFSMFGFSFDSDLRFFFLVWICVMVLMLLTINIIQSRVGRALRALHSSEVAADAMGVNTGRYKTKAFVLSAVFAGLGGALFAHFQRYINPESFMLTISILFLTMVVIGGMGNIWGALVGAISLTFLPEVIRALPQWIPGLPEGLANFNNYVLVLYGLLLMVFMIFMPQGMTVGLARGVSYGEMQAKRLKDRIRARKFSRGE